MTVFDIQSPAQFLHSIRWRYQRYQEPVQNGGRTTEDILYVVMGLTHLREWIAPEKSPEKYLPECGEQEKKFSSEIYKDENFKILKDICNGVKHLKKTENTTSSEFGSTVDDWPDWDAVANIDDGPPTGHFVNRVPIQTIINPMLEKYEMWLRPRD